MLDTFKVYVFPDGEVYQELPTWKSDDYEIRLSTHCDKCDETITPYYMKPFASCDCGTQDWYL